jgi:hypothetical protein
VQVGESDESVYLPLGGPHLVELVHPERSSRDAGHIADESLKVR